MYFKTVWCLNDFTILFYTSASFFLYDVHLIITTRTSLLSVDFFFPPHTFATNNGFQGWKLVRAHHYATDKAGGRGALKNQTDRQTEKQEKQKKKMKRIKEKKMETGGEEMGKDWLS